MKNYLNKALLFKEWKSMYWTLIPLLLFNNKFMVMGPAIRGNNIEYRNFHQLDMWSVMTVVIVVAMSFLLIAKDKKTNSYEILNYMPFSKKAIIVNKIVIGASTIFASSLFNFIICSGLYFANKDIFHKILRYKYICVYFAISTLTYISILLLLMYVQCITNNGVFGTVLGVSIMFLPSSIVALMSEFSFFTSWRGMDISHKILSSCAKFIAFPLDYINLLGYLHYSDVGFKINVGCYGDVFRLLVLVLIILALYILMLRGFEKVNLEEEKIVVSKNKEKIFKIIVGLSIGFMASRIISMALSINTRSALYILIINMVFILVVYYVYNFLDRLIKLSKI